MSTPLFSSFTEAQSALFRHIEDLNGAPVSVFMGWVSDPAHWNRLGVETPEQFDHYVLVVDVYETTRDVHGYKPSWAHLKALTDDQLRAELSLLRKEADRIRSGYAESAMASVPEEPFVPAFAGPLTQSPFAAL